MKLQQLSIFLLITLFVHNCFAVQNNTAALKHKSNNPTVVFKTTMGSYTLELFPQKAPKTVANFLKYVNEGFYDNTIFHRVIPNFVIQGGGFETSMKKKPTHTAIVNESNNGLLNIRASISMARTRAPNSATSQFFINVVHNVSLDYRKKSAGYTVFGKVINGMDIIDKIINVPTHNINSYQDVPKSDVVIISATTDFQTSDNAKADNSKSEQIEYLAGQHYTVLKQSIPTRNPKQIEVIEMFSYGCPHCYEFEPILSQWRQQISKDIDFWSFPAVWNKSMQLFAKAFYTADELNVSDIIHLPLFNEVVVKQTSLRHKEDFASFFKQQGIKNQSFQQTFNSEKIERQAYKAEERVKLYKPAGVPEIIVNGKYRVDRMRANGLNEMIAVVNHLIEKERELMSSSAKSANK